MFYNFFIFNSAIAADFLKRLFGFYMHTMFTHAHPYAVSTMTSRYTCIQRCTHEKTHAYVGTCNIAPIPTSTHMHTHLVV